MYCSPLATDLLGQDSGLMNLAYQTHILSEASRCSKSQHCHPPNRKKLGTPNLLCSQRASQLLMSSMLCLGMTTPKDYLPNCRQTLTVQMFDPTMHIFPC